MDTNLFFELLQVALGTRDGLSRVPSAVEWDRMYALAEEQAIVGVLLGGLERLPEEQWPPLDVKLQWIGEVQMMEAEYRTHCERAKELTSLFRSVGFKSCVLKGVGTAQLYSFPERRQCGDIDLWVDGRREDVVKWLKTQCEIEHHVWHHVDAKIFEDVAVEVHVHPGWMYHPLKNRRLQRWFEHELHGLNGMEIAGQARNEDLGFNVPSVRFDAVFSLVHSFHHLLEEGIGLRHIVDYFFVLKSLQLTAFEDVMRVLRSIGLGKFAGAVMWVMKEVCGMPESELLCVPNEKEGKFLLSEIMAGGNFGQTRTDGKVRNSFSRWMMMVKHYPSEVLWMVPWKVWHLFWRMSHRTDA